jgi:hypothetical protein
MLTLAPQDEPAHGEGSFVTVETKNAKHPGARG